MNKLIYKLTSFALILVSAVSLFLRYSSLSERIVTHYNFYGEADNYGSKSSLFIIVLLQITFTILFLILRRFPQNLAYPSKVREEHKEAVYKLADKMLLQIMLILNICFTFMLLKSIGLWDINIILLISIFFSGEIPIIIFLVKFFRINK